jgi:hypothetical protein
MSQTNYFPKIIGAVSAAAFVYFAFSSLMYVSLETYFDHAEPNVIVRSWRLIQGGHLYYPETSPNFIMSVYGPVLFIINSIYLKLFGGTIAVSKLAGVVSALASVGLFTLFAKKAYGTNLAGLGALIFTCTLLAAAPISIWARPDPHTILLVTISLYATTLNSPLIRGWIPAIGTAMCIGLAVNLKAHAFIYFIPLMFGYFSKNKLSKWPIMATISVAVFLLPFFFHGISLEIYIRRLISMIGGRGIETSLLYTAVKYSIIFLSPVIALIAVLIFERKALKKIDLIYFAALFLCITASLYSASVPGASWYHFLPFLAISTDLILRFSKHLSPNPKAFIGIQILFAIAFIILSITPQKRFMRNLKNHAWSSDITREVRKIIDDHPGKTIEMGYGQDVASTYKTTFIRPILTFAGNPTTFTAPAAMELRFLGKPSTPAQINRIKQCKTDIWLIPTGEHPFTMQNYFVSKPTFWPEVSAAFEQSYILSGSQKFFDIWVCR